MHNYSWRGFIRYKIRNFIRAPWGPDIKFQFYEDKTESKNNGPPSLPVITVSFIVQVMAVVVVVATTVEATTGDVVERLITYPEHW